MFYGSVQYLTVREKGRVLLLLLDAWDENTGETILDFLQSKHPNDA